MYGVERAGGSAGKQRGSPEHGRKGMGERHEAGGKGGRRKQDEPVEQIGG